MQSATSNAHHTLGARRDARAHRLGGLSISFGLPREVPAGIPGATAIAVHCSGEVLPGCLIPQAVKSPKRRYLKVTSFVSFAPEVLTLYGGRF